MIKQNQLVEIFLTKYSMVDEYLKKGYNAEISKKILVKAEDISSNSHKKIIYICDYCGEEFERIIYSNTRSKKDKMKKMLVKNVEH